MLTEVRVRNNLNQIQRKIDKMDRRCKAISDRIDEWKLKCNLKLPHYRCIIVLLMKRGQTGLLSTVASRTHASTIVSWCWMCFDSECCARSFCLQTDIHSRDLMFGYATTLKHYEYLPITECRMMKLPNSKG